MELPLDCERLAEWPISGVLATVTFDSMETCECKDGEEVEVDADDMEWERVLPAE